MLEVLTLYLGMLVVIEPTLTTGMPEVLTLYLGMLVVIVPTLYLDNGHAGSVYPLSEHASIHRANPLL
jgi:hypothetical protein